MSMTTKYTLNCSIDAERPGLSKPNHIDPKNSLVQLQESHFNKKVSSGNKISSF